MFVSRYCSVGLYVLLNLNVLCHGQHGQHGQRPKIPINNGNVAYPESEEEDPAKQNAKVQWTEILHIFENQKTNLNFNIANMYVSHQWRDIPKILVELRMHKR